MDKFLNKKSKQLNLELWLFFECSLDIWDVFLFSNFLLFLSSSPVVLAETRRSSISNSRDSILITKG